MASLHLLRGAARLQLVATRQQGHSTVGGRSSTTTSCSCCYVRHRFPKFGGSPACDKARSRYLGVYRFTVRDRYSRFVARGSMNRRKAPAQKEKRPSVLEIQRAIGVIDSNEPDSKMHNKGSSSFMDLLSLTPVGQPESSFERKIREASEWVVENTESHALQAQKKILVACMMMFPVWLFLLLVASGVVQLPFSNAFLDNLLS